MAFFALLWKARTIENYRLNYEKEKINSIIIGNTQIEQTLSQRWRHYQYDTQRRISETFRKWYPENSGMSKFFVYMKTDQTFLNFLLKSVIGFIVGIILTYLCFMFFMFQLSVSLINATILSSTIGVLLTLGLAFSYRIRCLVFLLIPQLFSRVGRYTLTCYALVLILTGPATNTLKNSEVLSESMACSQEQIKMSMHQLDELKKKPYNFLKEYISLMMKRFKDITTQVKLMVVRLNRLVLGIVALIQSSYSWLQSISSNCNSKLKSPRDRCSRILKEAFSDCQKKDPKVGHLCDISRLVHVVCEAVEPYKAFCFVTDGMDESILASIRKKLKDVTAQISNLFFLKLDLQHTYSFGSNSSKSGSQVTAGIVTEIRNRADPLLTWLSWSSCVTSLFLLLIIFRAKYYQHMYETRSRFDNRYVTKEFRELDLKRQRQGRETVLPLNKRERAKYITTTSFRLVAFEKIHLSRSALFMTITTFKLLIHMIADYSLYWVLMTIRRHGTMQSELMHGALQSGVHVTGEGFVARLFTSILEVLDVPLTRPPPSPFPCLPDPYTPDFRRYSQIGVLIFLLWFFALFEPYGLRLRHVIMGQYKPERAKARANWLYYHILRSRCGFMKFARRKLHREYKYCTESSLTFRHWLERRIPFQCLRYLLGVGPEEPHCLLCGTTSSFNDTDTKLIRCETPRCPGVYCPSCFSDIGQLCTICLSPADYGDQSDVSLERGSSDDSDTGSELNETTHANENTRLIEHRDRNRSKETRSNIKRKCNSCKYSKSANRRLNALLEPSDCNDLSFLNECYAYNEMRSNLEHYKEVKKEINKGTDLTTKSIGVNTDKHDRLFKQLNFKAFVTRLSTWLKLVPKFKIKVKHDSNNKLNYNVIPNKVIKCRSLLTFQVTFVRVFKNDKHCSKIKMLKNGKEDKNNANNSVGNADSSGENKNDEHDKNDKQDNNDDHADTSLPLKNNTVKEDDDDKGTKTEPLKKKTKEETKKVKMKTSKHKTNVQTFFSNRWHNMKPGFFDRTKNLMKPDTVNVKEEKNHKRRKKLEDDNDADNDILAIKLTPKMDDKDNRIYRISAFLADGDWMKNGYKEASNFVKEGEATDSCSVNTANNSSHCRRVTVTANKLITMMQFTNLPFQWGKPTELRYCQCYQRRKDSNYKLYQQKQNVKKVLEKIKHKVNEGIISPSLSFIHKWINNFNVTKESTSYDESTVDSEWKSNIVSDTTYYPKQPSFYGTWRNKVNYLRSENSITRTLYKNTTYFGDLRPVTSSFELRDSSSIAKVVCTSSSYPTTTCNNMMIYKDTKQAYNTCCVAKTRPESLCVNEMKMLKKQKQQKKEESPKQKKKKRSKMKKTAKGKYIDEETSSVKTLASVLFRKHDKNTSLRCGVSRPTTMEYKYYKINTTNTCKAKKCTEKDAEKDKQLRMKYKDLEWAKVEEIDIHIEREKQIQEDILRELERHRCEEKRIVGDLACELARHKAREKRLMMDEGDELCNKGPLFCHAKKNILRELGRHECEEKRIVRDIALELRRHQEREKRLMVDEDDELGNTCPLCLGPAVDCVNIGESLIQISSGPSDLRLRGGIAQLTVPNKHAKNEVNPKKKCTCATQCVNIVENDSSINADIYIRELLCQGLPSRTQMMRNNDSLLANTIPPNAKCPGACVQTSKLSIESSIERRISILDKLKAIVKSNHFTNSPAIKDKNLGVVGVSNAKVLHNNVTTSTVALVASADCIETQVECKIKTKNKACTHKPQADEDQMQNLDKRIERDNAIEHLKASIYGDDDWYEYSERIKDHQPKLDELQIALKSPTNVSTSSLQSDDTETNSTTVCSLATLHYDEIRCRPRKKRYRVIAKVNQTTSMERSKFHNVGTETEYFWDPLLEKTENSALDWKTGRVYLSDKRKKYYNDNYRNIATHCGTNMREKFVQINSRPQVIPRGAMFECDDDILSPSRYLLQSQKYYNELFSIKLPRPQVEDLHNDARNQDRGEIPRPQLGRRHHQQTTKRLKECNSPKILLSTRKQLSDSSMTIESPRRKPQPHRININRYQEKQCSTRPYVIEREASSWPFKRS